jgi:glyoxylase-like metal-dependent hydrolase (beta-lactamase superfamily II)
MKIKKIIVGSLKTNCYIIFDEKTKKGVIIDPGSNAKNIIKEAEGLNIAYILNTHGHFDHMEANQKIKNYFKAKIAIGKNDAKMLTNALKNYSFVFGRRATSPEADILLKDKQVLKVDGLKIKVISIPGHSPGGVTFLIGNYLFSGDSLFKKGYGITPNIKDRKKLLKNIKEKIFTLPGQITVYPGHGNLTKIIEEKKRKL